MLNSGPARHTTPAQRALMRAGLLATVVGAAFGASATSATAAGTESGAATADAVAQGLMAPAAETVRGTGSGLGSSLGVLKELQINPMANTGSDPLDNSVGTQIADFREVSTAAVTGPLARGASLSELPVVGPVTGLLPG